MFTENTHVFTYLGLPCGKHHQRWFTTRGKGTVSDSRYQDAALPSLCSGCCRLMSHRAGKRSTLIMELHQFVTVPEISWRDTDLYCSVITTREQPHLPQTKLRHPCSQSGWNFPGSTLSLSCAHQEHISPTTCTRDVQRENQTVTRSILPLCPCCETDPCAGVTKED